MGSVADSIYLVPDEGQVAVLGDTPGGLYSHLFTRGFPVDGYKATFPQPHPDDSYLFWGPGLSFSVKIVNKGGKEAIEFVPFRADAQLDELTQAIMEFCIRPREKR